MLLRFLSVFIFVLILSIEVAQSSEPIAVWPDFAPGDTESSVGESLPRRPNENPVVTRVVKVSKPTFTIHVPDNPNGSAAVILPGGGFAKVVPDKEGTEAADWLNEHGITAFVLSYRTSPPDTDVPAWKKALQDAQRTISIIRSRASEWKLNKDRIGMVAFSAGGQVGARLLSVGDDLAYDKIDKIDLISHRPNFAVLIYPWRIYDPQSDALIEGVSVPQDCPPTFLVHTHDDRSSSLGAVLFYAGLKKHGIDAALHVYGNGGHGYGMRPVKGSQIDSWSGHAAHWLVTQGFANQGAEQ